MDMFGDVEIQLAVGNWFYVAVLVMQAVGSGLSAYGASKETTEDKIKKARHDRAVRIGSRADPGRKETVKNIISMRGRQNRTRARIDRAHSLKDQNAIESASSDLASGRLEQSGNIVRAQERSSDIKSRLQRRATE
tara:strand:- start:1688 stop:2095 length:408 start_codon:yes stop_codon:yes gene_type:complete